TPEVSSGASTIPCKNIANSTSSSAPTTRRTPGRRPNGATRPTAVPAIPVNAQWLPRPVRNTRTPIVCTTDKVGANPPVRLMELSAWNMFSTTMKPSPTSAPTTNPSTGPRTARGKTTAMITTPTSLSSSSLSGAVSAAPQDPACSKPRICPHRPLMPVLAQVATPVTADAPHTAAVTETIREGDRTGRTRRRTQKPTANTATHRTEANSACGRKTNTALLMFSTFSTNPTRKVRARTTTPTSAGNHVPEAREAGYANPGATSCSQARGERP